MKPVERGADIKIIDLQKSFGSSQVLRGLERPSIGGVLLDGEPLRQLNRSARVMFQDARLLMWKRVKENVGLGLKRNWQQKANWALEQVGLAERAEAWPAVLSGGQRQRVALARACIFNYSRPWFNYLCSSCYCHE